ncbi:hypothetical protein EV356DRAFT_323859 [Viridothelium virens]|uniref:F-box domain-containing protein n=1 Tax=Viridothelium virens TaxID=1048519 RepID=A0A6A6GY58_VIRVR|nr:hypothetical protein EV356DRAFT_323859 [Viridothelium virens]
MTADKTSWRSLAPEIRLMILKALIHDGYCSRYATVCQEWQDAIEQKNFSRLRPSLSRVAGLRVMAHRQRGLVRCIWLCTELQEGECSQCEDVEADTWQEVTTTSSLELFRSFFPFSANESLMEAWCSISASTPPATQSITSSIYPLDLTLFQIPTAIEERQRSMISVMAGFMVSRSLFRLRNVSIDSSKTSRWHRISGKDCLKSQSL